METFTYWVASVYKKYAPSSPLAWFLVMSQGFCALLEVVHRAASQFFKSQMESSGPVHLQDASVSLVPQQGSVLPC